MDLKAEIGVVTIGRNEGLRLIRCFESLTREVDKIVYVDSHSTDSSLQEAEKRNILSVSLDMSIPFTAARARNAGTHKLLKIYPNIKYIFYLDGDCELVPGFLKKAYLFLENNPRRIAACGRRVEKFPEQSIFNQFMDVEWSSQVGETNVFGGDVLVRKEGFQKVNGFDATMIAGEDPDFAFRLSQTFSEGNQQTFSERLPLPMTLHDGAIYSIGPWIKRVQRSGYAYAHSYKKHGWKYKGKNLLSLLVWGILPWFLALLFLMINLVFTENGFLQSGVWSFAVIKFCYIVLFIKLIFNSGIRKHIARAIKEHQYAYEQQLVKEKMPELKSRPYWFLYLGYITHLVWSKMFQSVGAIKFFYKDLRNKKHTLIEYK